MTVPPPFLPDSLWLRGVAEKGMGGLREDSVVLAEQTTICNKNELLPQNKLEHLNDSVLDKLDNAIAIQFDLYDRRTTQRHISKRRNAICLAQ